MVSTLSALSGLFDADGYAGARPIDGGAKRLGGGPEPLQEAPSAQVDDVVGEMAAGHGVASGSSFSKRSTAKR